MPEISGPELSRLRNLEAAVKVALSQRGDDVCYRDLYNSVIAKLVGVALDPDVLPREQHLRNCARFYDCLAADHPYRPPAHVDPQTIADLLNSALKLDPAAIHALMSIHIPAPGLLDNPDLCASRPASHGYLPTLTVLGLLNGLCNGTGKFVIQRVEDGDSRRLVDFVVVQPEVTGDADQ